ncbi:MAG: prolyl oligopeptidase family serine peptidase [Vicinamibacterales bacterium]
MRHIACAACLVLLPSIVGAQDKTVPTPASVKVEGMPPMPQSMLDGVARYGQFRQAQMIAWHPTKRQVLVTTNFATPQLHLVEGPLRDRRQLTWFAAPGLPSLVDASFDPADGNMLAFHYDSAGAEARSIYRYDLSTGQPTLVVEAQSRYTAVWSHQGKWLAYDSSERNGKDRDLYVIQPSNPVTKRLVAALDGPWSPHDWSPDGSSILVNEVFTNAENYLWRIDVQTGQKTPITKRGDGQTASWLNARFSADGRKVYAVSDRGGEARIWRCDIAACAWTPVSADGVVVDPGGTAGSGGFELSPDGSMIAYVVDKGATTELQVINAATLKARTLPAIPRGIVSQLRWRPGSREIGFTLGSVKAQGDVYSVDIGAVTLTRWTMSETTFNPDVLPSPEVVSWKSFDGEIISGILYRPAARFTGARPVMIQIHGGPDIRERAVFRGRSNYLLNELGVAIIYPNVRGSAGFGRKFEQLDNGRGRDGAIKDVGALLDWIGTRPELDGTRVVLNGVSYGGWLALESGIVYNDRIRGVIEGAGITDFVTFLDQTDAGRQENRRGEYGDERDPAMREYLKSISPVTRASELKKPTLILHPGKDTRVPVGQAQELVKALKANNAPVWYLEFSEANHDTLPGVGGTYLLTTWMWFFRNFVLN